MYGNKSQKIHGNYHTVSILVNDEPGVLSRIANMFMKRNFNIDTLTVGPSIKKGISRMTISFFGDDTIYEQLVKQLNKLIDVIKLNDLPINNSIITELALVKISAKNINEQNQVMMYCQAYRTRVINITHSDMIVEIVGRPDNIESFIQLTKNLGLREISRTGTTAMSRGHDSIEKS
ncbi:acetolactate synthase small subunit [Candidatus Woesearchaeota archaeon]|nr:acetolactate synthase small subunit [Candidatus Woesearchaeota archaeon]|tara:strand:- start:1257 stop:1787 length:531 start_codon:yes stop_codon:yes gene_type:complete